MKLRSKDWFVNAQNRLVVLHAAFAGTVLDQIYTL